MTTSHVGKFKFVMYGASLLCMEHAWLDNNNHLKKTLNTCIQDKAWSSVEQHKSPYWGIYLVIVIPLHDRLIAYQFLNL